MTNTYDVAIVGATGAVGEVIVSILQERTFPIGELYLLASEQSAGKRVQFNDGYVVVKDVADFDFSQVQIGFFTAGASVSKKYAQVAVDAGCVVIDNTSQFRYDADVPLVIPEVNPDSISEYKDSGIIANPNCSTMQMLVALKPIYDAVGIERINVATYQAVSGTGKSAVDELAKQTVDLLNSRDIEPVVYPKQIAFNVIPHIDTFQDNGYTKEEMKMVWETQKILGDENVQVNPTAVRVPVFFGHSEAVHIETSKKITALQARQLLMQAPGVIVVDDHADGGYATPVTDAVGKDDTFVSRIREDISCEKGLNLWIVSDNVRKGAALNAVQIGEILIKSYL